MRAAEVCEEPLERLFAVGVRKGVLKALVKDLKYQSVRAVAEELAELLDATLAGEIGADGVEVVVVPLPTIRRHVRERGLDHTKLIAKKLARRRGWRMEMVLERAANTVQVGAKAAERKAQAKKAYAVRGEVDSEKLYLLIDDVWTTGASMMAAAQALKAAGANRIMGAVVAISGGVTEGAENSAAMAAEGDGVANAT